MLTRRPLTHRRLVRALFAVCSLPFSLCLAPAQAQFNSAFTYQGKLENAGSPFTGTAKIQFDLYDASTGGNRLASDLVYAAVTDGLFTATPDFGTHVISESNRWIEISVTAPYNAGAATTLSPRTKLTATPRANIASFAESSDQAISSNTRLRVTDQLQSKIDAGINAKPVVWQSFTTTGGYVTQIVIGHYSLNQVDGVSFRVYAGEGTSGTLLSDQVISLRADDASIAVPLATPFYADPGSKYTFVISSPADTYVMASTGNPYAGGRCSVNASYDLSFQIQLEANRPDTILRGQRVGIGTGTPLTTLDVRNSGTDQFVAGNFYGDSIYGTWLGLGNANPGSAFWNMISSASGNGGGAGNLIFATGVTVGSASPRMTLTQGGRLGIGTTAPTRTLELGTPGVPGESFVRLSANQTVGNGGRSWDIGVPTKEGFIANTSAFGFVINDATSGRDPVTNPNFVVMWGTGNVGINTALPTQKLSIGGNPGVDGIAFPDTTVQTTAYRRIKVTKAFDPAPLLSNMGGGATFVIPGAAVGDVVIANIRELMNGGVVISQCRVVSADNVAVNLQNTGPSAIDLGTLTIDIVVLK
jgi:hypothetical protein